MFGVEPMKAGRQRRFFSLELFLLKDNSGILNIEAVSGLSWMK